jgi:hypothetical protein
MPPLRVFISYASADESLRQELDNHLSLLKRDGAIETWTFRNIDAGADWRSTIDSELEGAEIILLLVSASFIASDYCWNVEMRRALQRHREGRARLIPIILRECDWSSAPFAAIQALPPAARPVTSWRPRDKAWTLVAEALRSVAPTTSGATEGKEAAATIVPESAVQRAQRLAADSRARKVREDKLRHEGLSAARSEVEAVYRMLEQRTTDIRESTELCLEAGWQPDHCIVRLKPTHENMWPLTLHCYQYLAHDVEDSHINVRLLFGGMILPQERNKFYMDEPKEHTKDRYKFRLSPEGQWCWLAPHSGRLVTSEQLTDLLLNRLLQFQDDVESGKIKQPEMW